jgi:hypothetical protein
LQVFNEELVSLFEDAAMLSGNTCLVATMRRQVNIGENSANWVCPPDEDLTFRKVKGQLGSSFGDDEGYNWSDG